MYTWTKLLSISWLELTSSMATNNEHKTPKTQKEEKKRKIQEMEHIQGNNNHIYAFCCRLYLLIWFMLVVCHSQQSTNFIEVQFALYFVVNVFATQQYSSVNHVVVIFICLPSSLIECELTRMKEKRNWWQQPMERGLEQTVPLRLWKMKTRHLPSKLLLCDSVFLLNFQHKKQSTFNI